MAEHLHWHIVEPLAVKHQLKHLDMTLQVPHAFPFSLVRFWPKDGDRTRPWRNMLELMPCSHYGFVHSLCALRICAHRLVFHEAKVLLDTKHALHLLVTYIQEEVEFARFHREPRRESFKAALAEEPRVAGVFYLAKHELPTDLTGDERVGHKFPQSFNVFKRSDVTKKARRLILNYRQKHRVGLPKEDFRSEWILRQIAECIRKDADRVGQWYMCAMGHSPRVTQDAHLEDSRILDANLLKCE
mmetsp:Transcript_11319/g.36147  ORF Transcript_11319/g.36147 Transcript_11319/m.36147 type:complete len:244 (+) Transcript_11319:158-889(+)